MSRSRRLSAPSPWTRVQLSVLAATNVTAALVLLAAWWGSRDEAELGSQIQWLNLGVLALVVASGIDLLWLGNVRSGLSARRRSMLADVPIRTVATDAGPRSTELVRLARGQRDHRADCPLVTGKKATPVASRPRGRACEVCRP